VPTYLVILANVISLLSQDFDDFEEDPELSLDTTYRQWLDGKDLQVRGSEAPLF
jgi:hypothetical protein